MEILDINNLPELRKYSHLFRASYEEMFKIFIITDMGVIIGEIILDQIGEPPQHINIHGKLNPTLVNIVQNISKSLSIDGAFISLDRIKLFNEVIKNYDQPNLLLVSSRLKIINLYLTPNIKNKFSAILTPLLYKKDTWAYNKNYNILKSSNKVVSLIGNYETSHLELLNAEVDKFYNNQLGAYDYTFSPTIFYNQKWAFGQLIYPAFIYILTNLIICMLNLKSGGVLAFEIKYTPIFPALEQLFYVLESCFANIEYIDFSSSVLVRCNKFNRTLFTTTYANMLINACIAAQPYQLDNLYELDDLDVIYSKNIKPKRQLQVVHKLFNNSWKSATVHILESKFRDYFVNMNTMASQLLPMHDVVLYQYLNTFLLKQIMEIMEFMKSNNIIFSKYYYTLLFNYHNDIYKELYTTAEPIKIKLDSGTSKTLTTIQDQQYNFGYVEGLLTAKNALLRQVPYLDTMLDTFTNIRIKQIISNPAYPVLYKKLKGHLDPECFELLNIIYKKRVANILHIGPRSADIIGIALDNNSATSWYVIESMADLKLNGGADYKLFYKYPENFLKANISAGSIKDIYEKVASGGPGTKPGLITCFDIMQQASGGDTGKALLYELRRLYLIISLCENESTDCIIKFQLTKTNINMLLAIFGYYYKCFETVEFVLPRSTDSTLFSIYLICNKYKKSRDILNKLESLIKFTGAKLVKSSPPIIPAVENGFNIFFEQVQAKAIKVLDYMMYILNCVLDNKHSYLRKKTYCSELIKPFVGLTAKLLSAGSSSIKSKRLSFTQISSSSSKHRRLTKRRIGSSSSAANKYATVDEAMDIYTSYVNSQYSKIKFNPALQQNVINSLLSSKTKKDRYDTNLCIINVYISPRTIDIYIVNEHELPNDTRIDSIKALLTGLINYYKSLEIYEVLDTCLLIWISDHSIWNKYGESSSSYDSIIPICCYACQLDENYLLIPDSQFTNLSVHNRYHDGFIDWDNQQIFFEDQPAEKNNIIFFRGGDTTKHNHNLRMELLHKVNQDTGFKQNMIYEILTKQNYEPPWNFLNHRFLLNLPGQYSWSTRQKYNYLSRAFIINVRVNTAGDANDKHFKSFIDIFVPDTLCHNIDMKYYYFNKKTNKDLRILDKYKLLNKVQAENVYKQIKHIYSKYKSSNPLTNPKVSEAYRRTKLITNTNIIQYFDLLIKKKCGAWLKTI